MRILVFTLTGLAVILFVKQYFGQKGTTNHIIRGFLVGLLSLAVVIINTVDISLKRGLVWDLPFLTHTIIGTLFFISLILTSVAGYLVKKKLGFVKNHKIMVNISAVFLFLTLFAAGLIRLFR